jgi:uncharacterized membrane protein
MQYTTKVLIEKPLQEVIKKMSSVENMKHWQTGLVSTEHISGTPGEFGSKIKLNYIYGKRKMELIETITKQNLPKEFHATYSAKGIRNIQENYFEAREDGFTYWVSKNEYQPTSFAMNAMLFFMPNAFKKQTKTFMTNFKRFVETGISIQGA